MPILEIEIVGAVNESASVAKPLADAAGRILRAAPGQIRAKVRFLPIDEYAECGTDSGESQPVFVSLLMTQFVDIEERESIASDLANAFGEILQRSPESIHLLFEPEAAGRVAFGGRLHRE